MFCEVAVLLLIVASFILVGVLCTRRINSALLGVDNAHAAADAGRALRRQIVGITCFVFVAFVLRTALSIMLAVALQFQNSANTCPGVSSPCDATCYNEFAHITVWSNHTPAFQTTVVLISSPLSLLVALWGMTSKLMLQLMNSSQQRGIALSLTLDVLRCLRVTLTALSSDSRWLMLRVEQLRVQGALTAARGHLSTALHETTLASSVNDSGRTPTKRLSGRGMRSVGDLLVGAASRQRSSRLCYKRTARRVLRRQWASQRDD